MIWLLLFLLLPLGGGVLAWASSLLRPSLAKWVALAVTGGALALSVGSWVINPSESVVVFHDATPRWLLEVDATWIPRFGIRFHLGLDGLSLLLIVLTFFLGVASVLASWTEIHYREGLFHCQLLWVLGGVVGVFLALDLFLFYFFWELMLVPMYVLIAIWGHEHRGYASIKFFLFTQAGGLAMLLGILGLVLVHYRNTGVMTFDYPSLLGTPLTPTVGMLLLLAFLAAFLVKLPSVPFHTWLPDAHTEAPTAGSVLLAGLLLKTGAYGLIRFAVPLFPAAAARLAPVAMALGAVGILYGAVLAFAQTDLKRLVAYTSVSHLGFVLLAVFAWNDVALQGAVTQMLCHGLSTGGLFILVGSLDERLHTRDLSDMGGLWEAIPILASLALVFALGSMGLPGLGNFVGEFLSLFGAFLVNEPTACVASVGLVAATVYALWLVQKAFHGPARVLTSIQDLTPREMVVAGSLIAALIWIGVFPQTVFDTARPALTRMQLLANGVSLVASR